jgi:prolyl-tRNA editing enzyme YbaK/EbsC (Cys-tRNA(Pro) deacylase)
MSARLNDRPHVGATTTRMAGGQRPIVASMDAVDRFAAAARDLGIDPEVHRFPEGTRTAADAADAVGCDIGQIVKSLVFAAGDRTVLILTSGANRVDEAKAAAVLGVAHLQKADAAAVRQSTGFAIGGTPPFGHTTSMATVVDEDLLAWPEVWAAAGTPDTCFSLGPDDLVRLSGGTIGNVRAQ